MSMYLSFFFERVYYKILYVGCLRLLSEMHKCGFYWSYEKALPTHWVYLYMKYPIFCHFSFLLK